MWEVSNSLHLPHDLVDPDERFANVAASYPVILGLIDGLEPRSDLAHQLHVQGIVPPSLERDVLAPAEDVATQR